MKKKSVYLVVIIGTIVSLISCFLFLLFGNQAITPDQIARKVGLRLPAYQITKSDDNMDRTASSWSDYYYEIEFKEPLSEDYLQRVVKLKNSTREGDAFRIEKESSDEWAGYIKLYPEENRVTLEYTFRDALF